MRYLTLSDQLQGARSSCIVVGIHSGLKLSESAAQLDQISSGALKKILSKGDLSGDTGDTLLLYGLPGIKAERILLIGCGERSKLNADAFQKINRAVASALQKSGATNAISTLAELKVGRADVRWKIRQSVLSIEDMLYEYSTTKSKSKKQKKPLATFNFLVSTKKDLMAAKKGINEGIAIASGIKIAKDLGNLPGNICVPSYIANKTKSINQKTKSIKTKIYAESAIKKLKMGAFLSVSQGSKEPARLIVIEYKGHQKDKPYVLVGKGITFDTGGISIKPSSTMDEMKFDMCGAASVIGAIHAAAKLKLPINIVGIIASAENMPGSQASKPGDIVKTMSGKTVEILNTDAEGRLVLCDALTYAERYKPKAVIDIATLTGSVLVALGKVASGLLSNHESLAHKLLIAGKRSHDRTWQLPLWEEYQSELDSNFADIANIGGRYAGTITAACFLSRFTEKYNWAHIDIAGVAWKTGKEKGATGRPVSMLVHFLMKEAKIL